MTNIAFFDVEVSTTSNKIVDIGCILSNDNEFHKNDPSAFKTFIKDAAFICGHNIIAHDVKYLQQYFGIPDWGMDKAIDTLLLSPLLFPKKPYHKLPKEEKIEPEYLNNPLFDSKKSRDLFYDEIDAFQQLDEEFKSILYWLLFKKIGFGGFFRYANYRPSISETDIPAIIRRRFKTLICSHCNIEAFIKKSPVSFAYTLALLNTNDRFSITPAWVLKNYPAVVKILFAMRNTPCVEGCTYCERALDPKLALEKYFGFTAFRKYGNEPLQEKAAIAALSGKSILAVFPTGGGKSITFQVPALMSGENAKALTVVISPLQSLMKDQVDNLERKGITEAVTINGLLDPIERSKAIERVETGLATLLYISPESLRSVTIEQLLLKRNIARFVIDEAHCFSSWGQDFRVDYLYIGDFIRQLQEKKGNEQSIPVSCFTATAKQKVIEDIKLYFKEKLNLQLDVFRADSTRTNLSYRVYQKETEEEKYDQLRSIIESKNCPSIVYVARTSRAVKLAERLTEDGFAAKPYHGKLSKEEKSNNQNSFMRGEVDIMVATSAFGMGVDKSDVGAVIHYDISDSLENYIQEAGRAGRDEKIQADCFILFNKDDLDKHFILLNQTKISSKEINQIWRAIKDLTKTRDKLSNSALEIAKKAGWDDGIHQIETRVTTAIAALEDAGYLRRGQNTPRLYANSILSKTAQEAIDKIEASEKIGASQKQNAIRIIKKLFSSKSKRLSTEETAESRVDYISDQLGLQKEEVIRIIELLKEEKILSNTKDLSAFIKKSESINKSLQILESYIKLEAFLLQEISEGKHGYHLKEILDNYYHTSLTTSSLHKLKIIINFWSIKNWIRRNNLEYSKNHLHIELLVERDTLKQRIEKRQFIAKKITEYLYDKISQTKTNNNNSEESLIEFSVQELKDHIENDHALFAIKASIDDIEDSLFYLSRIEAITIEGGFMVVHNKISLNRLIKNNRIQYKESDYEKLRLFYLQKTQQIHIVGEYAKKMIDNYKEALQFVDDYFRLNYTSFLSKYFSGTKQDDIKRTLTPEKFSALFGQLSPAQLQIIRDTENPYILVAAGPGSGKTMLLVHKLASLLLTEDVKYEQLLMLTFSRAAATEFKKRLIGLIGKTAYAVEIKTFHSYCFDLLGKVGNLTDASNIIQSAIALILSGETEVFRITKTVLVIDEAQDMNEGEYELVRALMNQNEEMRVIFVGDDDQNIYHFRGSDSRFMLKLLEEKKAIKYELTENYRSKANIVSFANEWASRLYNRIKRTPGFAHTTANGVIDIIAYSHSNMYVSLVRRLYHTELSGSTCILTKTNEEAELITGLLLQKGIAAKLIQSNEHFMLSNMYEIRYFSTMIASLTEGPVIDDEDWDSAKRKANLHFEKSSKRELANAIIKTFEEVNANKKYLSDWNHFLHESKIEDFLTVDTEIIYVSTMHKAKGKEFNNVFMLLKDVYPSTEEDKRLIYVAITRAKSTLSIHYNHHYFKEFYTPKINYQVDHELDEDIQEITIFLSMKDVNLGYFEYRQHQIAKLYSGASLHVLPEGLGNDKEEIIVKYSASFKMKMEERRQKGFQISKGAVNYIVYWKNENMSNEIKVVLPQVIFSKKKY